MQTRNRSTVSRRAFASGLGALVLFAPALARGQTAGTVRRNTSVFKMHNWQDHFDRLGKGIIISDTNSRVLQHWTTDGEMSMRERDPSLPAYMPPGPDNPLGARAMHLSWQYYRIHGTHDTRKIGRQSSNGCIGLYNEHIAELFELTKVGTQVLLI